MARNKNNRGGLIAGPVLIVVGTLCLWKNEGRFDYYKAALQTQASTSPSDAPPAKTISYSGSLAPVEFTGRYVTRFAGYYQTHGRAEIYSWDRSEDSDGDVTWSKGWYSHLDSNSRNTGLTQKLTYVQFRASAYQVGDLKVLPEDLHFVDDSESIPINTLTLSPEGKSLGLKPSSSHYYLRKHQGSGDELGDERLQYSGIPAQGTATYFGLIEKGEGVGKDFQIKKDFINDLIKDDGILHHLVNGLREPALRTVQAHLNRLKWIVRLAATGGVILGFAFFFSQLLQLVASIPFLGNFVRAGVLLLSIVLGLTVALVTIVASFLFHSPLLVLGIVALLVGAVLAVMFARSRKSQENARKYLAAAPPVTAPPTSNRKAPPPHPQTQATDAPSSAPETAGYAAPLTPTPTAPPSNSPPPWISDGSQARKSFANLVRLSLADGELDDKENDFLVNWAKSKGLSEEDITQLFGEARDTAETEIGPREASLGDLSYLISLALSDGHLAPKELSYIHRYGLSFGIERRRVNQAIHDVQSGAALTTLNENAATAF